MRKRFTPRQAAFIEHMTTPASPTYAAERAGYPFPAVQGWQVMGSEDVAAEIARREEARLWEALPMVVSRHLQMIEAKSTADGARIRAIELFYDRTLGAKETIAALDPSSMSAAELEATAARFKRMLELAERPLLELEANAEAGGVFG